MHELSIGSAVVEAATRHAAGRPILRIHLRVGALRQVVPDSLAFSFELCARGTPCEGATLELERVAAELHCRECQESWQPEVAWFKCPHCASTDADVVAGDELRIESIVVEEEPWTFS